MNKITIRFFKNPFEQRLTGILNLIPSDLWNFEPALHVEFLYLRIKYAEAFRFIFFRILSHQLQAQANAQHRLLQFANQLI